MCDPSALLPSPPPEAPHFPRAAGPGCLLVSRFDYSVCPWRLAWQSAEGTVREIRQAGVWWARKREALPVVRTLHALRLDWGARERWSPEIAMQVYSILSSLVEVDRAYVKALHADSMRRGL